MPPSSARRASASTLSAPWRDHRARGAVEVHAAQHRPHAAAQLGDPDRLGHVVVGARLEREHGVGLAVARGDGDHVARPRPRCAGAGRPRRRRARARDRRRAGRGRRSGPRARRARRGRRLPRRRRGRRRTSAPAMTSRRSASSSTTRTRPPRAPWPLSPNIGPKRRAAGAARSAAQHDPNMPRSARESHLGRSLRSAADPSGHGSHRRRRRRRPTDSTSSGAFAASR